MLKPINTRRANSETDEEPLSPVSRLFHTPAINCIIIAVFGFKKRLDVEVFKNGLENSLSKHPRFCSKLVSYAVLSAYVFFSFEYIANWPLHFILRLDNWEKRKKKSVFMVVAYSKMKTQIILEDGE